MNAKEKGEFINWMEEKCKALDEEESFTIPEKWVSLPIIKAFRSAYNKQNKNKVAVTKGAGIYIIERIPPATNVGLYEEISSKVTKTKKNVKEECLDRIQRAIAEYFEGEIKEVYVKYIKNINILLDKKVIPYNFIRMKVISNTCFRNGAEESGLTKANYLRTLLQELVDNKTLLPMTTIDAELEFETEAELYVYIKE